MIGLLRIHSAIEWLCYLVLYQKVLVSKMTLKMGISQLEKANNFIGFYKERYIIRNQH